MLKGPLTDAFGSRLQPGAIAAGLDEQGLSRSVLVVTDAGLKLVYDGPDELSDPVSRAVTWLRSVFSPLVPVEIEQVEDGAFDARIVDQRTRLPHVLSLVECDSPSGFRAAARELVRRLAVRPGEPGQGRVECPPVEDGALRAALESLADAWGEALTDAGVDPGRASLVWLDDSAGVRPVGSPRPDGPHMAALWRRGGDRGTRPGFVLAASTSGRALEWFVGALDDPVRWPPSAPDVLLDGLAWGASRRPTVAVPADGDPNPIRVDPSRCDGCGECAAACPVDYLDSAGRPAVPDASVCIRCYECIDTCPTDALRPTWADDTATSSTALVHRGPWLSRLRGAPGPLLPAPFPPSWLRARHVERPRVVLGLAIMTMQEHAAALIVDGRVVGAIEEEKVARFRHYGWRAPGRQPFITAAVDPTLCIEEILCHRSVRGLLAEAGLTLDDVDLIAVNGLHGRFRRAFSLLDESAPIPVLRAGRVEYVPHHLCHAASAMRVSGSDSGWIFTVDGRGDRETAAVFRADDGEIRSVQTLLSLTDRSIGGVYEGVTRLLGFGSHGQGSVMALAGFGEASRDMSAHLSVRSAADFTIHESGINEAFSDCRRTPDEPLEARHHDLAASVQSALEDAALTLVGQAAGDAPIDGLFLAGGVALNCHMNQRLRLAFAPDALFAQPGANDGGTALGAAAEAHWRATRTALEPMDHALLGPRFDDDAIERAIRARGLRYTRHDDVAEATAERVAGGEILCWFQGRLEYGPRALGARSIVADPRSSAVKDRVNQLKQREPWRPFGPSILAGHEQEWLETPFDSRFMLFTLPVREDRRGEVPAVVHIDGTTRPQSVHADTHPEYHAMIAAFHRRTGVPMVLNTSFNRKGEPIVCTPEDAVDAFLGLGADALAIGSFIVEPRPAEAPLSPDAELAALPGGRRLALRLTTQCDLDCVHCTMRDTRTFGDRSTDQALRSLAEGRRTGCDELVILRGEALLRPDIVELVARARAMGYRFVQLQVHGASLARPGLLEALSEAGVDAWEMQLVAGEEALHDALTRRPGSFRAIAAAIQRVARSGAQLILTIPVLRANVGGLRRCVAVAQKLGVQRIQFSFPRPVELVHEVVTWPLARLTVASTAVRHAARYAESLGLQVTTEGFPLCHLDPQQHTGPDISEGFDRHRIDDLAILHDERGASRQAMRPDATPCRDCSLRARCPKTWAVYLELFGTDELVPVR